MAIISGLVISVDAFFIGLSLGMQKKCKFLYLALINVFLFGLCVIGYLMAGQVYEHIPFDPDIIVGIAFISLGLWTIAQYFMSRNKKESEGLTSIVLVGLVMSVEAMLVTMGITLIFLPHSNFAIPITVALAHFVYSAFSFYLARTERVKKVSTTLSHIISGSALIIYGLMALFVPIDEIFF